MKFLIEGIQWNTAYLQENGFNLYFQHVTSHINIFGNEVADNLAKSGMEISKIKATTVFTNNQFTNTDNWKYINFSAVNKMIKNIFYKFQLEKYEAYRKKSEFGILNQDVKIKSVKFRKKELKFFNRLEMRWILAIRTGHDWFNYYQHKIFGKRESGFCDICHLDQKQTIAHFLLECTDEFVYDMRRHLQNKIWTYYHETYTDVLNYNENIVREKLAALQWDQSEIYLSTDLPDCIDLGCRILKSTIGFLATLKRVFIDRL